MRYTDAINLFEYSFNNFSKKTVASATDYKFNYINADKKLIYSIGLKENLDVLMAHNEKTDISYNISINNDNLANLNTDNFKPVVAGTITFNLLTQDGEVQQLVSDLYLTDIQALPIAMSNYIAIILSSMLIISLILIILLIIVQVNHLTKLFNIIKYRHLLLRLKS